MRPADGTDEFPWPAPSQQRTAPQGAVVADIRAGHGVVSTPVAAVGWPGCSASVARAARQFARLARRKLDCVRTIVPVYWYSRQNEPSFMVLHD